MGRARGHHHAVAGHAGVGAARRPSTDRKRVWSDDDLHAALAALLDGRPHWPSQRDFTEAGRTDLYYAVKRRGGVLRWSQRLGVSLKPGQDRARPYTDQDAVRDATALQGQYGFVPGPELLRQLGYARLATHIRLQHQNTERFAAEHGLTANVTHRLTLPGRERQKSYVRLPE